MGRLRFRLFRQPKLVDDDEGTVTVDFVVLTAALATLGVVVFAVIIRPGVHEAASDLSNDLTRTWN